VAECTGYMVSLLPPNRLPLAQQERLMYIDMRLQYLGEVRRQDLVRRFGIQTASATRDLALYREECQKNVLYVLQTKSYVRADSFVPLYDSPTAEDALTWLCPPPGQSGMLDSEIRLEVERGPAGPVLDKFVLAAITRAIKRERVVTVRYRSETGPERRMMIAPHSLADIRGVRLVRAFDRETNSFISLDLHRLDHVHERGLAKGSLESPENDHEWRSQRTLSLAPHPKNVRDPADLLRSYGVKRGSRWRPVIREALVDVWLEAYSVDKTNDYRMKGPQYCWWLEASHPGK
jgi:hypothetical protein